MTIHDTLKMLEDTGLASAVRGDSGLPWLFPIVETLHVLALAVVFGSILMVDLRLLGVNTRSAAVTILTAEMLPYTWGAFLLAAVTGSLMFISKAQTYFYNLQFEFKMLCILLAALNMLVFQFGIYRRVQSWDMSVPTPALARVAGTLSICLWAAVIFLGRWIGFTT
jgi:hypothetical protein